MIELWADIPGFEGYQISNQGNLRSCRSGSIFKTIKVFKRCVSPKCNHWRPVAVIRKKNERKCYTFYLSRLMWEIFKGPIPDGMVVDHKDRNPFNNDWDNLRLCSVQNNVRNRTKSANKKSKYKGVEKHRNRWQAVIVVDYKRKYLGLYATELEAARAYDIAAKEIFKEFACLNFSQTVESGVH